MSQDSKTKTVQTSGLSQWQKDIAETLGKTYSPYVGQGTLGGLSDVEQKSLDMLKSADVWSPLTTAAKEFLTGQTGPEKITPEKGLKAYQETVVDPYWDWWQDQGRAKFAEELSGPSFLSRGKQLIGEELGRTTRALNEGRSRWMWDIEQANRAIDEAKAGRALSALGVTPGALSGWTGALFGTGQAAREIENAISDPEVIAVLQSILGLQTAPVITKGKSTPSQFQQAANWAGILSLGMSGLGGWGGGGGLSGASTYGGMSPSLLPGGYGGGF